MCIWLQVAYVGLHKFSILKRTISKEDSFALWVKIISLYEIRMVWQEIRMYRN